MNQLPDPIEPGAPSLHRRRCGATSLPAVLAAAGATIGVTPDQNPRVRLACQGCGTTQARRPTLAVAGWGG